MTRLIRRKFTYAFNLQTHNYRSLVAAMNSSNGTTQWASLVHRSIEARNEIRTHDVPKVLDILQHWTSLDEFLEEAPKTVMFWFFQRREAFLSQKTMQKWSRDRLYDYVLLPTTPGYVLRSNCFFASHF